MNEDIDMRWGGAVRSVRADIYRAEVALYDDVIEIDAAQPRLPEWRYVTDDGDRTVVVTDLRVRLEGWSIIHTSVDEIADTSDFGFGAVWRDDDGNLNSVCDGDILGAWEAPIPQGSNLDAFVVDGTRLDVDPWDAMTEWPAESMYDQPLGFLIELGPQDYDESDDSPVVCAQVVFLSDGVLMLRLSKQVLERLSFADYSSDGLALDTWHYDGYFDDCRRIPIYPRYPTGRPDLHLVVSRQGRLRHSRYARMLLSHRR